MELDFTVEYCVRLEQQKRRVIPQTEYCLPFEVARLGEKQVLSQFVFFTAVLREKVFDNGQSLTARGREGYVLLVTSLGRKTSWRPP